MDLVRRILLATEQGTLAQLWQEQSREKVGFHIVLMAEAGLVKAIVAHGDNESYPTGDVLYITWSGYDFLDAARKPAVWEAVKSKFIAAGVDFTFDLLKENLIVMGRAILNNG